MCTVNYVAKQLTDPKVVLKRVHETLHKVDPAFADEEQKYHTAVETLEKELEGYEVPSVHEYVNAVERAISAKLVYVAWLGLQLNLDCFHNPVNAMILKCDYEDIHRERRMHTLPEVQAADTVINIFYEALRELPEEKMNLTDGIIQYISYLETTGFKIAHYFGFLLADRFLGYVIPGYTSDPVITMQYAWDLREYLQLDLMLLEQSSSVSSVGGCLC